jgi:hypothetical protein
MGADCIEGLASNGATPALEFKYLTPSGLRDDVRGMPGRLRALNVERKNSRPGFPQFFPQSCRNLSSSKLALTARRNDSFFAVVPDRARFAIYSRIAGPGQVNPARGAMQ